MNTIEIKIDKKKYNLQRSNLRQWLHLEDIRSKIIEAAGNKDIELVVESMYSYISSAFGFNLDLEDLPWIQVVEIYAEISLLNAPKLDFPILKVRSKKDQIPSWDYEGRTWYFWSHMLARNYGWNLDYIANFSGNTFADGFAGAGAKLNQVPYQFPCILEMVAGRAHLVLNRILALSYYAKRWSHQKRYALPMEQLPGRLYGSA